MPSLAPPATRRIGRARLWSWPCCGSSSVCTSAGLTRARPSARARPVPAGWRGGGRQATRVGGRQMEGRTGGRGVKGEQEAARGKEGGGTHPVVFDLLVDHLQKVLLDFLLPAAAANAISRCGIIRRSGGRAWRKPAWPKERCWKRELNCWGAGVPAPSRTWQLPARAACAPWVACTAHTVARCPASRAATHCGARKQPIRHSFGCPAGVL